MGVELDYKDQVKIVSTTLTADGYGTEVIEEIHDIDGLMIHNSGLQHSRFRTEIISDAEVYLDPEDEFIQSKSYRLEGMYILANQFNNTDSQEWYKIIQVIIGEDKLLDNEIDTISCQLKKTSEVPSVS